MFLLDHRKYDPSYQWRQEPSTEDGFASTGDVGIAGLARGLVKALEAQGRGFAHGHEKIHSEPQTKAIDFWHLILHRCSGPDSVRRSTIGASEHSVLAGTVLDQWMRQHREEVLLDATTKQYDSSIECGRQFGVLGLKEVFTHKEQDANESVMARLFEKKIKSAKMPKKVCDGKAASNKDVACDFACDLHGLHGGAQVEGRTGTRCACKHASTECEPAGPSRALPRPVLL